MLSSSYVTDMMKGLNPSVQNIWNEIPILLSPMIPELQKYFRGQLRNEKNL